MASIDTSAAFVECDVCSPGSGKSAGHRGRHKGATKVAGAGSDSGTGAKKSRKVTVCGKCGGEGHNSRGCLGSVEANAERAATKASEAAEKQAKREARATAKATKEAEKQAKRDARAAAKAAKEAEKKAKREARVVANVAKEAETQSSSGSGAGVVSKPVKTIKAPKGDRFSIEPNANLTTQLETYLTDNGHCDVRINEHLRQEGEKSSKVWTGVSISNQVFVAWSKDSDAKHYRASGVCYTMSDETESAMFLEQLRQMKIKKGYHTVLSGGDLQVASPVPVVPSLHSVLNECAELRKENERLRTLLLDTIVCDDE